MWTFSKYLKKTLSECFQESSTLLSPGELDVPSPVSHVSVEVVPTVPDREPSETCAVEDTCSPHSRCSAVGTATSTLPKRDTLSLRLLLLPESQLFSRPAVTSSTRYKISQFCQILFSCMQVAEVPLVVSDKIESFRKTKEAVTFLRRSHLWADIEKVNLQNFRISPIYSLPGLRHQEKPRRKGKAPQPPAQAEARTSRHLRTGRRVRSCLPQHPRSRRHER